jgi:PAS domain S-box-containing protein
MSPRRRARDLAAVALLAAAYVVAGKLGLSLAFVNASATAVWPPTGIAIAGLLLLGLRAWPGVFLGAFVVNLTTAGTFGTSLGIATGNTLEGVVAALLVGRFAGGAAFPQRALDAVKFAALAALLSTTVSATVGVTTLVLGGLAGWASYGAVWLTWWLGDAMGALVVAPLVVVWAQRPWPRPSLAHAGEAALLVLAVLASGVLVFGGVSSLPQPLGFLLFPFIVWGGLRFRHHGATGITLLAGAVAVPGTLRGLGPFGAATPNDALLLLQGFLGVVSLTGLVLAALVSERARVEDSLRRARDELEARVEERTGKLSDAVRQLREEVRERARAEDVVRSTVSLLHATLESTADGLLVVDREGRVRSANHKFAQMWRIPDEVLAPRQDDRLLEAMLPQLRDPDGFLARVRALYAAPEAESFEVIELQDGRVFERSSIPQRVDQAVVGRVWSFRDVTEQRRAERQLRRKETLLREAERVAQSGSWEWDVATGAVTWSDEMYRIYGHEPQSFAVTFERAMAQVHPDDAAPIRANLRDAFASPRPADAMLPPVEYRIRLPGGEERTLRGHGKMVGGEQGRPLRVLGTVQDITERARAEQERRLAEQRLQELERLQEMDVFKTQFLNTAAHELSTPLTPIKLQLEMLRTTRAEELSADQRRVVDILQRNVDRMAQLVQDILEAARLQAGRLSVVKEPVDLQALLAEAVESFQAPALQRGVAVELRAPQGLRVDGDPKRLAQVLLNLLSNAWKFTPEGGRITVEARAERGEVTVRVTDTGVGLRGEDIARLFQPFTQVHDATMRAQGTGLGLYISRGILDLHGGRIWCESPGPGRGATFAFTLPLLAAQVQRA